MAKLVNIFNPKLFSDKTERKKINGNDYEIGQLYSGQKGIVGIYLDADDPHYHDKLNKAINDHLVINMAVNLPPDAADMWLKVYDEATIEGKSGNEAENIAWEKVNAVYYRDSSGRWIKLSEWQDEVTKQIEPVIEIARVGTHKGSETVELTSEDLDSMIKNFDAGMKSPAITNDHRQVGPSFGGVKELFRKADRLFAKLKNLTTGFIEKVRNDNYKHVSIEFYKNYTDGDGKEYGALLDAISFLGALSPAIKGMEYPAFSENGLKMSFSLSESRVIGRVGLPIEGTQNYIRIRQKDPSNYSDFRIKVFSSKEGIKAILGHRKDSDQWEVQSILFDKDKGWTEAKAKTWIKDHGYKIMQSEPLNTKKGVNLVEITQEQLDAKIKEATDAAVKTALADSEAKHKAELEKAKSDSDEAKKQLAEAKQKDAETKAVALFDKYSSKDGGGKLLPAQKDYWVGQLKTAILSEKEDALKKLTDTIEGMPDGIVGLAEMTKANNDNKQTDSIKFSDDQTDEDKEQYLAAIKLMEKRSYKFKYAGGVVVPDNPKEWAECCNVVAKAKND